MNLEKKTKLDDNGNFNLGYGRILGDKEMDRMLGNGWTLKIADWKLTSEEQYEKYAKSYKKVKIYRTTTRIRGCYDTIFMLKD